MEHNILYIYIKTLIFQKVASIALNHIFQPFRAQRDNYLETLTILAALFAYSLAFTLSIDSLDYGSIPIVVFYFFVNVVVVLWCVAEFIHAQMPRIRAVLAYMMARSQNRVTSTSMVSVRSRETTNLSSSTSDLGSSSGSIESPREVYK